MSNPDLAFLDLPGRSIAYRLRPGGSPALLFLPGYASDMEGAKALALDAFAARARDRDAAARLFRHRLQRRRLRRRHARPLARGGAGRDRPADPGAADRRRLVDGRLDRASPRAAPARPDQGPGRDRGRARFHRLGVRRTAASRPSMPGPQPRASGSRASNSGCSTAKSPIDCPVRLVHGEQDRDVPVDVALRTMARLRSADVQLNLIKGGGHRLSEPHEIEAILRTVDDLLEPRFDPVDCRRHRRLRSGSRAGACLPRRHHRRSADLPGARGPGRTADDEAAAQSSRRPRTPRPTTIRPRRGCSPRPATCGSPRTSRERPRSTSTRRWPCPGSSAEQRGEALLDRARAAEAQNDLQTARAKATEAAATISDDPFYWYFSAALAIRENDAATAQAAISKALTLAPADPTILFEAGHVAHFTGDDVGARRLLEARRRARPRRPDRQGGARCAGHAARAAHREAGAGHAAEEIAALAEVVVDRRHDPDLLERRTAARRAAIVARPRHRARRPRNSPGWRS